MPDNRQKTGRKATRTTFKPGYCGNPGGRPKKDKQAETILRVATADAARKLVELKDSDNEKIALAAAEAILDRVNGKPYTSSDLTINPEGSPIVLTWGDGSA
jgi:hypothetical protein